MDRFDIFLKELYKNTSERPVVNMTNKTKARLKKGTNVKSVSVEVQQWQRTDHTFLCLRLLEFCLEHLFTCAMRKVKYPYLRDPLEPPTAPPCLRSS